ncbi:MAG: GNAT family N-acetyltransferase, partial [Clostridia bacterium]|nr:GNAT family N-acetyltransferase [Clostridia bacterium]
GNIHFRTAELGYYIGVEHWGKGIMTEAVRLVCKHVFDNTDIVRIYAEPFAENIGSCRILEKNGFHLEGIMRKNAYKNGVLRDMKLYALVK